MTLTATRPPVDNAYTELSKLRTELSAMKRERDRIAAELERRKAETPSLMDFPPGMRAAATERAKKMDGDFMANVLYLCERWTYLPWLPDAPPLGGIMVPSPCEHPAHPMPELEDCNPSKHAPQPMQSIGAIIERLNINKGK